MKYFRFIPVVVLLICATFPNSISFFSNCTSRSSRYSDNFRRCCLTSIDVVGNDIDVDGDTLILASVTSAGSGTVSVNSDGVSVDYTPAANFNGTEIISYVVSDRSFTATGTLTVTVNALDDTAIAVADNLTVLEDAVLTSKNVIENDLHGDDITLTLTDVAYSRNRNSCK